MSSDTTCRLGERRGGAYSMRYRLSAKCQNCQTANTRFFFKLQKSILVAFWSENWVWQTTLLFWNINQVDICVSTSIRTKSFVLLPLNVKYLVFKSLLLHLTFSLSLSLVCVCVYVCILFVLNVFISVWVSLVVVVRVSAFISIYIYETDTN